MIELKKEYRAAKLKEFKESLKGIEYSSLCVLSGFMKDQIKIISNEKKYRDSKIPTNTKHSNKY